MYFEQLNIFTRFGKESTSFPYFVVFILIFKLPYGIYLGSYIKNGYEMHTATLN